MNKLYHYLFGDNVANYVKHLIKEGRSGILRRISKSNELDRWTKTQGKVLWSLDRSFPCRIMGSLARQNCFLLEIQLQQKIHSILHRRCTFINNLRDRSFLEITFSSETEEEVIKSYSTNFISTTTCSEPMFNL